MNNRQKGNVRFGLWYFGIGIAAFFATLGCSGPSRSESDSEQKSPVSTILVKEGAGSIEPSGSETHSSREDSGSGNDLINEDADDIDGLKVSFCGLVTSEEGARFKLYDWARDEEFWVRVGDEREGYRVVGLDPNSKAETLVLERGEYWFVYPLENVTPRGRTREKPKVLLASEIPEGVSIMDYTSEHVEPMNPSGMPSDMPVVNPYIDMDRLFLGGNTGDTMPSDGEE